MDVFFSCLDSGLVSSAKILSLWVPEVIKNGKDFIMRSVKNQIKVTMYNFSPSVYL